MDKILTRFVLIGVSIYFILAFLCAQFLYKDIMHDYHIVCFEFLAVVYCFTQGKFHCRFMRWTAISILVVELLTRTDNTLNFLSVTAHNLIPIGILALGLGTTITLAIRHFIHVNRLRNARKRTISNQENGTIPMG